MSDFDDYEDLNEEYETIVVMEEDGKEREFLVLDGVEAYGTNYLLVLEAEYIDDDEAEATILKQVSETDEESFFVPIDDDLEFERVAVIFQENSDEYDIEI